MLGDVDVEKPYNVIPLYLDNGGCIWRAIRQIFGTTKTAAECFFRLAIYSG